LETPGELERRTPTGWRATSAASALRPQRNLLYTGITRGKRLVVLVGQKKAVAIAVRNVSGRRRWSKLDEWLRPMVAGASPSRQGPVERMW